MAITDSLDRRDANLFCWRCRHGPLSAVLGAESTAAGRCSMKVMILTKIKESSENMAPPSEEAILAMHNYNEALIAAGILKQDVYGGLMPSQFAKRIRYAGKNMTVTDGPFTETKEVVAG